ncbi:MAG: acyltransferase [Ruminococcaceae bacterium]|nr:acyltransferase [Oscillospiraceae bacterium]
MVKKLYHNMQKNRVKKQFAKSSVFEPDVQFFTCAHCFNSGAKENIQIGQHCFLGCILSAQFGGKITIGNNVYIGGSTALQCKESITIGNNVIIANNAMLIDNNNHPSSPEMRLKMSQCDDYIHDRLWSWEVADSAPIVIRDNVWIGRDTRILKGVTVGEGSIVALGAVVTHDVPPYTVVAGNPAKVVKELERPENQP